MRWFENEFLDTPVQEFGDVKFVRGGAGDFMNPAELSEAACRICRERRERFRAAFTKLSLDGKALGVLANPASSSDNSLDS